MFCPGSSSNRAAIASAGSPHFTLLAGVTSMALRSSLILGYACCNCTGRYKRYKSLTLLIGIFSNHSLHGLLSTSLIIGRKAIVATMESAISFNASWMRAYRDGDDGDGSAPMAEWDAPSRYLAAVYWAMTTITTVGYGDICPESDAGRAFCLLAMIASSISR